MTSKAIRIPICCSDPAAGGGMLSRLRAVALLTGLAAFAAACAEIPTQELSQYRSAFAEVNSASEEILVDFGAAMEAAAARAPSEPAKPQSPLFSTQLDDLGPKRPGTLEVRRLALRTIDSFNNTLVTLAEGKSVEAVQNSAGGFVEAAANFVSEAAGSAVPGLSAVVSGVRSLAGALEKARLRDEFETAVRDGAPVIDKMLVALIDERSDHLTLRADEANQRAVNIVDAMTLSTATLRNLVRDHGAPGGENPLPALQERLDAALAPAATALAFPLPLELQFTPGLTPFAPDQGAIAQQAITDIEEQSAKFKANVAQYESLRSALNNYGVMLEKTRVALNALVEALDRPPAFQNIAEDLFQVAFNLKRDIEAFRAARKAAQ